jgi:hypothetical protein
MQYLSFSVYQSAIHFQHHSLAHQSSSATFYHFSYDIGEKEESSAKGKKNKEFFCKSNGLYIIIIRFCGTYSDCVGYFSNSFTILEPSGN